ncbi:MAG TPA: glutamate mutase L [Exilispira sp.]|nr:glutamate mutase L [Exilispira sp.]
MKKLISIDIGSTYTKGVLFHKNSDNEYHLNLINRVQVPTTTNHLADGFFDVLKKLLMNSENEKIDEKNNDIDIFYSSSAKGGLNIIAIGIVPELTLKTARLAALSAGGKITKSYSYRLTIKNIEEIDKEKPDIILLTGGTDGGNEDINIHNSKMLCNLSNRPVILYAGNSSCADQINEILSNKNFDVTITENVLPNIDNININPAKNSIREIFLQNIIHGKGLDVIYDKIGFLPEPTPLSVFNFISIIPENVKKIKESLLKVILAGESNNKNIDILNLEKILEKDWESFIAIDLGGATTDFYSYHKDIVEDSSIMVRGLHEPTVKRTVEGDLGMRVSAKAVLDSGSEFLKIIAKDNKLKVSEDQFIKIFSDYIEKVSKNTSYIPLDENEKYFDEIIAAICVRLSSLRHAGKYRRIFTVNGERLIQYGKNLKPVKTVIGSGGYLSYMDDFIPKKYLTFSYENFFNKSSFYEVEEEISLLPETIEYLQDKDYLLPLLANISKKYPLESTLFLLENLVIKG